MPTVLIIDDDAGLREGLAETLNDLGHTAIEAGSGPEGLVLIDRQHVDAVLLDLRMPGIEGIEVLRRITALPDPPPVAVLTAFATAGNTIEAMRLGAFDHLTKPIGRQDVADVIARMLTRPTNSEATIVPSNDILVGSSAPMRTVQKAIGLLADDDTTVLILGETGTGKELVARALHVSGRRARAAFVPVNCAAIPADLLESELFGHIKGAFTGATSDRRGAFREADGGTLFLDEIGDMPLAMQAKILRALEEREVTPVGGRPTHVDVRVVAATHRDLADAVASGRFREDLFYRLNVVPMTLPPLRDRRADIPHLAGHFVATRKGGAKVLSAGAVAKLATYDWPGNVRQLRNVLDRATALVRGRSIEAHDIALPDAPADARVVIAREPTDMSRAVADLERRMIEDALRKASGNRTEAARQLGINRQLLYTKMHRHGLLDPSEKTTPGVADHDA